MEMCLASFDGAPLLG